MFISENHLIASAAALVLSGILCGYLLAHFRHQKIISSLKDDNTRLSVTLDVERENHKLFLQNQELQKQQLNASFKNLSYSALKQNNETFLRLAKENLGQYQVQATSELKRKEDAFNALIDPIHKTLEKTQQQIQLMEKDRKESYGALNKHLETLAKTQNDLHQQTRNLVKAFQRPEVRGQWGELSLKRLVELAGMIEHCDFEEQVSISDDNDKLLRPDMVVRLPNKREIIVDCKTPLSAYLDAVEAKDETNKEMALDRHARHVKQRIKELSAKSYWQQFDHTPDFVVLFIPGDQFLNAALERERNLVEDALNKKIILATPTSLVALLRAVAYGWRQETMSENAEKIQLLGEEMYGRLATFTEHLSNIGKSLDQSISNYNKSIATFSSRVLPSARKFKEMGVQTKKELKEPEGVNEHARNIEIEFVD